MADKCQKRHPKSMTLRLAKPLTEAEVERLYGVCCGVIDVIAHQSGGVGYVTLPRDEPKKPLRKPVYTSYGMGAGRFVIRKPVYTSYGMGAGRFVMKKGKPWLYVVGCKGKRGLTSPAPLTAESDNEVRLMVHLLNEFDRNGRTLGRLGLAVPDYKGPTDRLHWLGGG